MTASPQQPTAQHVAAGLYVTFLESPRIIIYHLHDVHTITIDAWYETNKKWLLSWPEGVPIRGMHDLNAGPNVVLTPRLRTLTQELLNLGKNARGRTAIATRNPLGATMVSLLTRFQSKSPIQTAVFQEVEEALAWLREDF